jgi:nicotinate phosphoribosyltransferase
MSSALLVDLYELTMAQAYLGAGMNETASFELVVRRLPPSRNFLVAAGLEQTLDYLETFRVSDSEVEALRATGLLAPRLLDALKDLRFTGDVWAVREGTIVFPDEPLLRVTAPLLEAQVMESRLINLMHLQTLIASKAARVVLAAGGRAVVDFGLRRAHGAEAALLAARAAYLAGFDGTSNVLAGTRFGIPLVGTMAHSYIQAHDDEDAAFEQFAAANPGNVVLLLDTYDTEAAARSVVAMAPRLASAGLAVQGVRLDSGDLAAHARQVRHILDAGGLHQVRIVASSSLDEYQVRDLLAAEAPIDTFAVGTRVVTSADAPYVDLVYKLVEYAGRPRYKRAEGKPSHGGRKQTFRTYDERGLIHRDAIVLVDEPSPAGVPLLEQVMGAGRRVGAGPPLSELRGHAAAQRGTLPPPLRSLDPATAPPVTLSAAIRDPTARV